MAHQRRRGGGRFFNRDAHNLRPFQVGVKVKNRNFLFRTPKV
jgi:hypothetical protein